MMLHEVPQLDSVVSVGNQQFWKTSTTTYDISRHRLRLVEVEFFDVHKATLHNCMVHPHHHLITSDWSS